MCIKLFSCKSFSYCTAIRSNNTCDLPFPIVLKSQTLTIPFYKILSGSNELERNPAEEITCFTNVAVLFIEIASVVESFQNYLRQSNILCQNTNTVVRLCMNAMSRLIITGRKLDSKAWHFSPYMEVWDNHFQDCN